MPVTSMLTAGLTMMLAASPDGGAAFPDAAPVVPALQRIGKASESLKHAKGTEDQAQAALALQRAVDAWAGLLSQNKVLREKQAAQAYVAGFNAQAYGVTLTWCERTRFFRSGGEGYSKYLAMAPSAADHAEAEKFLAQAPLFCPEVKAP